MHNNAFRRLACAADATFFITAEDDHSVENNFAKICDRLIGTNVKQRCR